MLKIHTFPLGPVMTNTYLVVDAETKQAVLVDPAWNGLFLLEQAVTYGVQLIQIWITHAHFDHIGGVGEIAENMGMEVEIALHPLDLPLWKMQGGASLFGIELKGNLPEPALLLEDGQQLTLGRHRFQVRHAPGHTPGHVLFYEAEEGILFCGDVIFQGGIGRTDLPGGSYETLMESIKTRIMNLPGNTRLFPGHGAPTRVETERRENPFLAE